MVDFLKETIGFLKEMLHIAKDTWLYVTEDTIVILVVIGAVFGLATLSSMGW